MIKKDLFSIIIAILLLFTPSLEIANVDPAFHLFYSRPHYTKYMDVQCCIVNREQLATVFSSVEGDITELTNNQLLNAKEIYLFIRVRNKGKCIPFGRLNCFVPHVKEPFPIEVEIMFSRKPSLYAFRLDSSVLNKNDQKPIVRYQWENIYCL